MNKDPNIRLSKMGLMRKLKGEGLEEVREGEVDKNDHEETDGEEDVCR